MRSMLMGVGHASLKRHNGTKVAHMPDTISLIINRLTLARCVLPSGSMDRSRNADATTLIDAGESQCGSVSPARGSAPMPASVSVVTIVERRMPDGGTMWCAIETSLADCDPTACPADCYCCEPGSLVDVQC